jgi:hypothetical protein
MFFRYTDVFFYILIDFIQGSPKNGIDKHGNLLYMSSSAMGSGLLNFQKSIIVHTPFSSIFFDRNFICKNTKYVAEIL